MMDSYPDNLPGIMGNYLDMLAGFPMYSVCVAGSSVLSWRHTTGIYPDNFSGIIGSYMGRMSSFPVYSCCVARSGISSWAINKRRYCASQQVGLTSCLASLYTVM